MMLIFKIVVSIWIIWFCYIGILIGLCVLYDEWEGWPATLITFSLVTLLFTLIGILGEIGITKIWGW